VSKIQVKNIQQNCSFARLHKIVRMDIYNSVRAWSLNHTRVYNFGPDTYTVYRLLLVRADTIVKPLNIICCTVLFGILTV
jgi:hypothetical protein